jgi:D-alanine transaminase
MLVYLNGEFLPRNQALISVEDRGFLFGDGVYEVTRALGGRLFEEESHWRRLEWGMEQLALPRPEGFSMEAVRGIAGRLLQENGLAEADATVYLQLTRGVAPRMHAFPPPGTPPTLYITTTALQVPWELRQQGVKAITHPDLRWGRCELKTVNLLPNVLAKQRAREAGAWEAILVRDGAITEGSSTSVFVVMGGRLHTHPKGRHILPGITRDVVIALAGELGLRVHETPPLVDDRHRWDELLLVGTTTDVQPVVTLDGAPVGDGRPGAVCRALQAALYRRMGVQVGAPLASVLPGSIS